MQSTDDVVFCTLRLLGVAGAEEESDVFRKGRPGAAKLLLELVHGLLSRFDREQAAIEFRGVWPVLDKGQEKDARKAALAWLGRLEQAQQLPPDCARLSDLAGAKGERVYALLGALCRLALHSQLLRLGCLPPRLPELDISLAGLTGRMLRAAALRLAAQRSRFVQCCARAAAALREHRAVAAELTQLAASCRSQPTSSGPVGEVRMDASGAEGVRQLWSTIGRVSQAASLAPQTRPLSVADPAAVARRYGALAARVAASCGTLSAAAAQQQRLGGAGEERAARFASLLALQARLERRLEQLAPPAPSAAATSAARLAAAASRVAPSFDKSFSPRKKLVL